MIIGIDFSINSPGICILGNDFYKIINIIRTNKKLSKINNNSAIKILNELKDVSIHILPPRKFSDDYFKKEREKILDYIDFSNFIIKLLKPYLSKNSFVAMEGISFGSSGNALIDLSMATAILRSHIIKKINHNNFFIFSPMSIKKFAIKGNANKKLLYLTFINKMRSDFRFKNLINILNQNKDKWIKKSGIVETPCSDIIDAIWISLFLEYQIKNSNNFK